VIPHEIRPTSPSAYALHSRSLLLVFALNLLWAPRAHGWDVVDGPPTDKPAAWLILRGDTSVGQLTVGVSGEAEMDWGAPDQGGERHYEVPSHEDMRDCVTDLEDAVGLT
jgi:hypothetical protein